MSKKSKSKGADSKRVRASLSTSKGSRSSGFKYSVRGSNGRFVTREQKQKEVQAIARIKENTGLREKSQINKILYSPKPPEYTNNYTESALDYSQNFDAVSQSTPKVVIITTDGERLEFTDLETAKAVINENVSALWRVATLLEQDAVKADEKSYKKRLRDWVKGGSKGGAPRKRKRGTFIPEYRVTSTERIDGRITFVEYNFSDNNLNPESEIDRSQWDKDLTKF